MMVKDFACSHSDKEITIRLTKDLTMREPSPIYYCPIRYPIIGHASCFCIFAMVKSTTSFISDNTTTIRLTEI